MENQEEIIQDVSNLKLHQKYYNNKKMTLAVMKQFAIQIDQKLLYNFMEFKKNALQIIRKLTWIRKKLMQKFFVQRYHNSVRIFIKFVLIFVVDKVIVLMVNANA